MISNLVLSQFQGSILGGAIGDALGYPAEFLSLEQIKHRFGGEGITSFHAFGDSPKGLISDDTQWTLAYAHALMDTKGGLGGNLTEALKRRAMEWYQSPENNRAPGKACLEGCKRLLNGYSWFAAGNQRAKGSGANMRVAPFGLVYANQPALLDEVTATSTLGTHRNPTAIASAIVTARIIAFALQCGDPDHFRAHVLEKVTKDLYPHSWELLEQLRKCKQMIHVRPEEAFVVLGEAWVAEEAVAAALYCVLSTNNFRDCVLRGVNTNGDSDTIAAVAGNIAGALYGISAIPTEWIDVVEKKDELLRIAAGLANLSQDIEKTMPSKKKSVIHDSRWSAFSEILRALTDPESSLGIFKLYKERALKAQEPNYGRDIWLDPEARDNGNVYLSREERDRLIVAGLAKEEEFFPLDSYLEIMQMTQRLFQDSRLSLSAKMAIGILNSPLTDPWTQEKYAQEISLWMASYPVISDEAIADLENRLYCNYSRWHPDIRNMEWAVAEIAKDNPAWVEELKMIKGLKWESVPPPLRLNYEKFILGLKEMLTPYIRTFGWSQFLVEWYFVAHAAFFIAHRKTES